MLRLGDFIRSGRGLLVLVLGGGALAGVLLAGLGVAQDQSGPPAPAVAGLPSFADIVDQVRPAVVTVAVTKEAVAYPTSADGAPFGDFFRGFGLPDQRWTTPTPVPQQGEGSGFIIDPDGYIATNYHVVEGARSVTVTLDSGEMLDATVVGTDPRTDLAVIKIDDGRRLPALRFGDSDRARVGEWVLAIGNPFGLGGSVTAGIISARGRDIQSGPYDDYLQIDAPINAGNSGGPVLNTAGEVIGINTAIFSPSGGNVGIGFAIPSNQARHVLDELREDGDVSRGWLGVEIGPADQQTGEGAQITRVMPNGPADSAGVEAGDVVTRFDGQDVDSFRTLSRLVGSHDAGDKVDMEVQRDGKRIELTAELGMLDETQLQAGARPELRRPSPPQPGYRRPGPYQRPGPYSRR
jgi:serine protease Do